MNHRTINIISGMLFVLLLLYAIIGKKEVGDTVWTIPYLILLAFVWWWSSEDSSDSGNLT